VVAPAPEANRRQRGDDGGTGDAGDDHAAAEADARPVTAGFFLFDALDVSQKDGLVVERDLRTVLRILTRGLPETVSEQLRPESVRHLALRLVFDRMFSFCF
jgi:hypothetical protein